MARQSRYDLINLALGGDLPTILADLRAEGRSYDEIAYQLRERGIVVSGETIRQWHAEPTPTEVA